MPGGLVQSDRGRARALAARLGVELEPRVFDPEHGVSTLAPYTNPDKVDVENYTY